MKVIESYGKGTVAVCGGVLVQLPILTNFRFPSSKIQNIIGPNERARKMLRIYQLNLFHIRRSSCLRTFAFNDTLVGDYHGSIGVGMGLSLPARAGYDASRCHSRPGREGAF